MTEPLFDTIVCLSFTEWAGLPHNSRHLMSEAARRGYRVLWVDPLGLRSVRFQRSDIDKLRRRAHELRHPLIEVDDGIWRLAPAGVPFQDTRVGAALNRRLLSVQIKAALRRLKAKRTLLWVYSPQQVSLCNKLDCDLTLYYRTDAYPAAPGVHAARVEQLEAEAARLADLCIATNERSISDLPRGTRRSLLVRNGIDLRVFDAESEYEDPIPEVGRPRLLVIGTFDHWMNTDLLYTLMREHPDWSLVLAGDCKTPIDRLTALDNVTYLGRLSFAELPALVSNCDIGLVPFRVDPFTTRGSPGKIYQYLAMGLPVLCTPFLEARAYSEQLAVAPEEPAAFAAALAEMLRSDSPALARARREFAAKQAWVDRFDSIENELRLIREQSSVKRVVLHAVGARPNFVKMAPVIAALGRIPGIEQRVVHTGQHYDRELSDRIADDLDFPKPDYLLGIGSGTHAEQIGRTMVAFERVLIELKPDLVVVGGDVNATLACALTAARLAIPVAHVEAGLRSGDWTMPEEMNRVLTDRVSDFLFTHSPEARANLLGEGIAAESICDVGNTMIDSLRRLEPFARARRTWERVGVEPGGYILVTLHRPSNVDDPERFSAIADELVRLSERAPVIFPVHPRTRQRLRAELNKLEQADIRLLEPLGYLDFLSLESEAGAIVTDSGGVQEEASAFGVACFTLRPNTERPITIVSGTNTLLGDDPSELRRVSLQPKSGRSIPLWDGHAGERVAEVLAKALLGESAPRFEQLSAGLAVPGRAGGRPRRTAESQHHRDGQERERVDRALHGVTALPVANPRRDRDQRRRFRRRHARKARAPRGARSERCRHLCSGLEHRARQEYGDRAGEGSDNRSHRRGHDCAPELAREAGRAFRAVSRAGC